MRDIRKTILPGSFMEVTYDYGFPKRCKYCDKKIYFGEIPTGYTIPIEEKEGLFGTVFLKHVCEKKNNH